MQREMCFARISYEIPHKRQITYCKCVNMYTCTCSWEPQVWVHVDIHSTVCRPQIDTDVSLNHSSPYLLDSIFHRTQSSTVEQTAWQVSPRECLASEASQCTPSFLAFHISAGIWIHIFILIHTKEFNIQFSCLSGLRRVLRFIIFLHQMLAMIAMLVLSPNFYIGILILNVMIN